MSERQVVGRYPTQYQQDQLPSTELLDPISDFDDSADLRDYLEVILRHKWLVLTVVGAVFVAALVVSLSTTPLYRASGRLELDSRPARVTKFEDMIVAPANNQEFIPTQVKLLQSDSLAERVIQNLNLGERDAERSRKRSGISVMLGEWRAAIQGWLSFSGEGEGDGEDNLAQIRKMQGLQKWFASSLEVKPERNTTIIGVSFSSENPKEARDVTNALIREFIGWGMDKRIEAANAAKLQLEKQLEVARIQLEKAESNLNGFAQKAGIVSLNSNLNLVYSQLEEMNKTLTAAQTDRIQKESLYAEVEEEQAGGSPPVVDSPLLQRLKEEHAKVSAEQADTSEIFKQAYPKQMSARGKMGDLLKKIQAEEERIRGAMKNDYLTAVKREETLKQEAEAKKELALKLNNQAIQYKILEREVETSKLIHQSLLERSKEIDAKVGTELANVQVVDYANLPLLPYKPRTMRNLALALVVGLMGGVGLAFLLEYMDNTIKRVDEVTDRFQIPLLGVLPTAKADELEYLEHLIARKPKAGYSEAVRTTKVSIQLSNTSDLSLKSIVLTSTAAGEGKTTTASNLAQAFAASDERVVLVDGDLRKPRLHKVMSMNGSGPSARKGLSQYLSGICGIEEVIRKTDIPNLYFISAGPIPPNPAELLASSRMQELLRSLGEQFDRIIVDAPPASGFADVLVLGHHADGVILISTLGQTHREALRIFRRSLFNVRGNLLGCIVNKLNLGSHYGGYYYKYYKYYTNYYQSPYREESPAAAARETLHPEDPEEQPRIRG
jgi:capsular exopolysaccharide synthesis family protein